MLRDEKKRLVVEVPRWRLKEFDKQVEAAGTSRTWRINKMIDEFLASTDKEAEPTYFHKRSVARGEGKRSQRG